MRISTVRKSTAVLYLAVAFLREPEIMRMAISESRQSVLECRGSLMPQAQHL